jgi:hypothetical protein
VAGLGRHCFGFDVPTFGAGQCGACLQLSHRDRSSFFDFRLYTAIPIIDTLSTPESERQAL